MLTNLKTFLDLIAFSEGTSTHPLTQNDGYDVIVTGVDGPKIFTDYSDHPFAHGGLVTVRLVPLLQSSAAGRYQVLARYWNAYKAMLKLSDFGPQSQDAVAIQQIRERKALPMIEAGKIGDAITACSNIWASLPGNSYGQAGGHSMDALLAKYAQLTIPPTNAPTDA
jgi:muramidase (phage lysozyme)